MTNTHYGATLSEFCNRSKNVSEATDKEELSVAFCHYIYRLKNLRMSLRKPARPRACSVHTLNSIRTTG
jgi:hypothetical protein